MKLCGALRIDPPGVKCEIGTQPMQFACPAVAHAHIVEQLIDLASYSPLPVRAQVVLARSRSEGFSSAMSEKSVVLMTARRRPWRTAEQRLANAFAAQGHEVGLFYVE